MTTFSQIISYIKASMPELNSSSVAGFVNKLAEAVGQAIDNTIAELSNTQTIITGIITNKNFGHYQYYTDAALAYQVGDNLSIDTFGNYYYAVINKNNLLIAQAAFEEVVSGTNVALILKVAKVDTSTGLLAPLTTPEKTAFDSYFGNFEIPGLPVTKISNAPNSLTFDGAITYGKTFDLTTLQSNVAAALVTFQETFTFNGIFFNYFFENYLVANVPGVKAVYISNTQIDSVPFSGSTKLSAGYFNYGTPINLTYASI